MQLDKATIAVTGATGFLGSYLVDALLRSSAKVVAVVRNLDKAKPLAERGAELRKASLEDRDALRRAFAGVDAVISNAAMIAFTRPRETMRTNVEGTRNVFEALGEAGVRRAINISSASAYAPSLSARGEDAALRPGRETAILGAYGESKAAADKLAAALSARYGIDLTTFRPCGITGPDDPLLRPALARFMRLKVAPLPIGTRIGVVHGADVASAVCSALSNPHVSRGKVYNLQGHTVSLWELSSAYKRAGGPSPWLRIPLPFPYLLRFDDSLARRELNFSPRALTAILAEWLAAGR